MGDIPPERSGMASGILSSQRALGSTAGFAVMGSILAVTISVALPTKLEPLVPDHGARDEVVDPGGRRRQPGGRDLADRPGQAAPRRLYDWPQGGERSSTAPRYCFKASMPRSFAKTMAFSWLMLEASGARSSTDRRSSELHFNTSTRF